jgi:hypothetical protein
MAEPDANTVGTDEHAVSPALEQSQRPGGQASDSMTAFIEHHRTRRWAPLPLRFEIRRLEQLVRELGLEWNEEWYAKALKRYTREFFPAILLAIVFVLVDLRLIMSGISGVFSAEAAGDPQTWKLVLASLLFATAISAALWFISISIIFLSDPRMVFFWLSGKVVRCLQYAESTNTTSFGKHLNRTLLLRNLGRTGRELFALVQRGRFRWTAPPDVASHALEISCALLDVDVFKMFSPAPDDDSDRRKTMARFVADVACAVAIRHEHLVPEIRSLYPDRDLPRLTIGLQEGTAMQDYLDPMQGRTRWGFVQHSILPIFAAAIAIASLVVSIVALGH